ncbi:response regulator transcription factor [Falsiroseomonas ponticola]|jgi:DNA-binding response OmpR family regulator|uniref:response regulator transcription factor n=1 Tax=Falsiroseomonas ponticola TaxID=2786951 RepID=UPI001931E9FF|nr:response regulator transcription factor [Roseomonas ponticola]
MPTASSIAVLEHDGGLRLLVTDYLRLHGFATRAFADAAALRAGLAGAAFDVVLLGLPLPGADAAALVQALRALSPSPGLILLGGPALPGADDLLPKPFPLRGLLARLRLQLRRRAAPAAPPPKRPDRLCFAGFTLCRDSRRLLDAAQAEVALTPMEVDLLLLLADHPAEVLSRERLLVLAHGKDVDPLDRSIDIRITRLRRKIEADPAHPRLIRTIRGQGYVFTPEDA